MTSAVGGIRLLELVYGPRRLLRYHEHNTHKVTKVAGELAWAARVQALRSTGNCVDTIAVAKHTLPCVTDGVVGFQPSPGALMINPSASGRFSYFALHLH
jgi:hypothetical protein